jgi:hypothetical protein
MKINDFIKELEELKKEHGEDITVQLYDGNTTTVGWHHYPVRYITFEPYNKAIIFA